MKYCIECRGTSPADANFCINCSAPFANTGATRRLEAPQDPVGSAVYPAIPSVIYYSGSAPYSDFSIRHNYGWHVSLGSAPFIMVKVNV